MFYEAFRLLLENPVVLPSYRQRMFTGYPQQRSFGNIFNSGYTTLEAEVLAPNTDPQLKMGRKMFYFVMNKGTPDFMVDLATGLQCSGTILATRD
jgi:hypothetical protein